MSGSGVPSHEMSGSTDPDEGFERLLRGEIPGTPEEQELGAFVEDVRAAFPTQPLLAEEVHLVGIVETAQLSAEKGEPVMRLASKAIGRGRNASGLKRRRVAVRVPVLRSLAARIVAGLVVLMSMFGGLAVAGALPGGFQDAVANAADGIGVDLPGGDDEDAVEEESEAPATPEVETDDPEETDVEADDQGEDGDQVDAEDTDDGDQVDAEDTDSQSGD